MLISGSKLIIPQLRSEESLYLSSQSNLELQSTEGIPVSQGSKYVNDIPVRWKRMHMIWVSMLITFPMMVMLEFSYGSFFGGNPVEFIVGFRIMMMFVEAHLSRAVREALLVGPLSSTCEVVLFVATMGADDFIDFIDGFFTELILAIVERLVLGTVIEFMEETAGNMADWIRSRGWWWTTMMTLTGGSYQKIGGGYLYNMDDPDDMSEEDEDAMPDEDEEDEEEEEEGV
jgi:hypothetical protein